MTIDHYDKLAQQFQCLQWAVHEGLVQARDVDRDLEYFGFYHEVLVGYHDYLLETLENDGWLGEYVTEDQTPFLALIPRLLEVQTGIEKWQDHYAKIMAKAVDLPDDAPEACR